MKGARKMGLLITEIVVGVVVVLWLSAVFVAARADDREASAKLDLLADDYVKASDENAIMTEALTDIYNLGQSGNQTQAPSAAIAQQALARVGKTTVRKDRDDVTPQPGRFNA